MAFGLQQELPPQTQAEATAAVARQEKEKEARLHERDDPMTPEPKRSRVSSADPSSLQMASPVKDSIRPQRVNQGRAASFLEPKQNDFMCIPVKRKVEEEKEDVTEQTQKPDAPAESSDSDDSSTTEDPVAECCRHMQTCPYHPLSLLAILCVSSSSMISWFFWTTINVP